MHLIVYQNLNISFNWKQIELTMFKLKKAAQQIPVTSNSNNIFDWVLTEPVISIIKYIWK